MKGPNDQDSVGSLESAASFFLPSEFHRKAFSVKFLHLLQCNAHVPEGNSADGLPQRTKTNLSHSLDAKHFQGNKHDEFFLVLSLT